MTNKKEDLQYHTLEYCGKPFVLRKSHIDEDIFRSVLIEEEYGYFRLARDPDVIVDAGANIGAASVYFANKYPMAKVYAIEPAEDNYEILCLNVEPYDNIIPLRFALMGKDGSGYIQDVGSVLGYRIHLGEGDTICHRIMTFCDEVQISHIDLLKMDIEGAEKGVFQDADTWISMVDVIAIELHDRFVQGCNQTVFEIVKKEFPWEWTGGENFFFARENRAFPIIPGGFKRENPQRLPFEELVHIREEKDQALKERETTIEELVHIREKKDQALKERETTIEELILVREEKDRKLKEQEAIIEELSSWGFSRLAALTKLARHKISTAFSRLTGRKKP